MANRKKNTLTGIKWSGIERFSVLGVQFVTSIILARLLQPSDFGLIALTLVVINILNVINTTGFTSALVQKLDRDELDFSTVFVMNVVLGLVIYIILYFISPWVAVFFDEPQLAKLVRFAGLSLIISSFTVVQRAKLWIEVDFKTLTKASFVAIVVSGVVGIYCAYSGFGVMSLVIQLLVNNGLTTLGLWVYSKWRPSLQFSYIRFINLFNYAYKLILVKIINTIFNEAYSAIIGKAYSSSQLGYFNRAKSFETMSSNNIINIVQRVSLPVLCEDQNDHIQLGRKLIKFTVSTASIVYPLLFGVFILAEPLVSVLLTDKWLPSVPILKTLTPVGLFSVITAFNMNVFNATGRTDWALKSEIIKKVFFFITIVIAVKFGFMALVYSQIIIAFIDFIITTYYTKEQIGLSLIEQLKALKSVVIASVVMSIFVFISVYFIDNNLIKLFVGSIVGVICYSIICYTYNIADIRNYINALFNKMKNIN